MEIRRSVSHWGAFRAEVADGRIQRVLPFELDPAPSDFIKVWPEMLTSPLRVAAPVVRRGWLQGDGGAARGSDDFVEIGWDEALDRVAGELGRVRRDFGSEAILGGSYGWASAGRVHHARTLLRRILFAFGGCTDQATNYSYGAAMAFLPRVLGRQDCIGSHLTSLKSIAAHTDMILAFGGLPDRNWQVLAGGLGSHDYRHFMNAVSHARLVNISPRRQDVPDGWPAEWLAVRPNTDTALLLALCHHIVRDGRHDRDFLARYCSGFGAFASYLDGSSDGTPKSAEWASPICGVPAGDIRAMAKDLPGRRVMVTATWSLQRARHGEQPYWAIVALAAILGQIGLPGGGFAFGYGSMNGQGNPRFEMPFSGLPTGRNPAASVIPVARVADLLLDPGGRYRFKGETQTYADIRLVYWAGGNPFHHHQDLNRLRRAFRKPETVIVNECYWTATARHADIVLPATTPLERNDIGGSSRGPYLFAMHKLTEPVAAARNDFDIFADLAERLGDRDAFTGGRDEWGWVSHAWQTTRDHFAKQGVAMPDLDDFWSRGYVELPTPDENYVMFADYRADPEGARLATPSGKIELFSTAVRDEGGGMQPGHPAWLDPEEWLGSPNAARFPLHLLSPQPARKLHGQMDASSFVAEGKVNGLEPLTLSPADAARRGLAQGAAARVFNDRGSCYAYVQIDADLLEGVALLPTGSSYDPDGTTDRGSNPNVLTRDIGSSELGQGCAAQSCLVQVERCDTPLPPIRSFSPPRIVT